MVLTGPSNLTDSEALNASYRDWTRALHDTSEALVLDLSGVESSDSKLIACLVAFLLDARSLGIECRIIASDIVRRWTDVLGLAPILTNAA